jgi:hypothetical protein
MVAIWHSMRAGGEGCQPPLVVPLGLGTGTCTAARGGLRRLTRSQEEACPRLHALVQGLGSSELGARGLRSSRSPSSPCKLGSHVPPFHLWRAAIAAGSAGMLCTSTGCGCCHLSTQLLAASRVGSECMRVMRASRHVHIGVSVPAPQQQLSAAEASSAPARAGG